MKNNLLQIAHNSEVYLIFFSETSFLKFHVLYEVSSYVFQSSDSIDLIYAVTCTIAHMDMTEHDMTEDLLLPQIKTSLCADYLSR